jgi:AraC family transcriptional regulator, arabinose operon regulatory protein
VGALTKTPETHAPQEVLLPPEVVAAHAKHPLLQSLLVGGAGFVANAPGRLRQERHGMREAMFLLCLQGNGWCELPSGLQALRKGDLLVVPPRTPFAVGAHASAPWTVHWVQVVGDNLPHFLRELSFSRLRPVLTVGEDLSLARLFNEILKTLRRGRGFEQLLQASLAFGHLLGILVAQRREHAPESADATRRVAETIVFMSEHLHEPLRVPDLARLANISPNYFTEIFKQQTGCSPRDYLHLLRIHRACQLLSQPDLSIKMIASRLGYQDPFHFSRQFKAFQGLSPTDYRSASRT